MRWAISSGMIADFGVSATADAVVCALDGMLMTPGSKAGEFRSTGAASCLAGELHAAIPTRTAKGKYKRRMGFYYVRDVRSGKFGGMATAIPMALYPLST
jgi:hypothetical protein